MKIIYTIVVGIVLIAAYAILDQMILTPKIAYVDTSKLLVGFSEAAKVERELKAEDDKWKEQMKTVQDSLESAVTTMSKEYDRAAPAKKKELQDILSARNQQLNNFKQANMRKMEELRQKKLQSVFEKANLFMAEYGKKHHYSIVFGTGAGGSILYGDERTYDITGEIIKGLNERYK
jgi:outer membrane protein